MYVSKDPRETHTNGSAFKTPSSKNYENATSITKLTYIIFILNLFGGAEGWRKVTSLMHSSHTGWHRCCRLLSTHFSWHAMPWPNFYISI